MTYVIVKQIRRPELPLPLDIECGPAYLTRGHMVIVNAGAKGYQVDWEG